jgi:ABC-2 type transport system ATP-binding protein
MQEAATLAGRVGIMDHGHLLALDAPEALMRSLPGRTTLEVSTSAVRDGARERLVASLAGLPDVERAEPFDDAGSLHVRLYLTGEAPALVAPAAALLAEHGLPLTDVNLGAPTLEDVFIHLTGRALR